MRARQMLGVALALAASMGPPGARPVLAYPDEPVDAKRITIRRRAPGVERVVFVSPDPNVVGPAPGGSDDPRTAGALLELFSANEGVASFNLPAGAEWTFLGGVYRYRSSGPVVSAFLRSGRLKILTTSVGLPLAGPLGAVGVRFTTGERRICALSEGERVVRDQPGWFFGHAVGIAIPDCSDESMGAPGP